jgi:polygalacturonase
MTSPRGDGTNDDRGPIQAAIDAATARGGGTVVFPAGTFRIGGALTIRSQVVFRGAGVRTTVIRESAGANYPLVRSPGFPNGAAYAYSLFNLTVYGRAGRGIWSEYFEPLPADGHSMEAMLVNVTVLH